MIDFEPFIKPGDGIVWSQGAAEPTPLIDGLLDFLDGGPAVSVFTGLTLGSWVRRTLPADVDIKSYGALGQLKVLADKNRLEIVPCHYSAIPRLMADGHIPVDVAIVQVSPPDGDGFYSLGIGVDYIADALDHARIVLAEVNSEMPRTTGGPRLLRDRFDAVIVTDRPLPEMDSPGIHSSGVDEIDKAIATNVAGLIENGDTIQVGVGSVPSAVADQLGSHAQLGVHSGLIGDGILDLVEAGVVTGEHKEVDRGLVTAGAALGSRRLYRAASQAPYVFRATSFTHDPSVLAKLTRLVSINSAFQVDLTGNVNAESSRGRVRGALGGQIDFSRAASNTGARSIIALRSTDADGRSSIVAQLESATVTTSRADVDFVVTENGVAELRAVPFSRRAKALASIAAVEHVDDLMRADEQNHG